MPSPLVNSILASDRSERLAITDARGKHTFGALKSEAERVARALLQGRASLNGERVALLVSPGARFVAAFFGVLFAGGCVVVLSPMHPLPETTYFCDDAGVQTIVVSPELRERVQPGADHAAATTQAARRAAPETQTCRPLDGARRLIDVESMHESTNGAQVLPNIAPENAALQLYTSGTTGKPKGAVITHANLGVQQQLLGEAWGWKPDDVLLHALPLHHLHGLGIALLTALGAGASARMLQFDAAAVWQAMGECTVFMGVPTMYTKLFAALDSANASTRARWTENARGLRLATSGSAALPVTLASRWKEVTGQFPLERFGMTEIGVGFTNPLLGERKPGTVGRALKTVEVRITGDDGNDAESGELWIAGPSVFQGYFHREEATREAFVERDGTRWFRTGDMVARGVDGYVKILGRTSVDILKSGGYKLSALEIEEALREHEAVAEVAVVGVPDETWGDRVVACIIARAGRKADCTGPALRDFLKQRLAPYKIPKDFTLVDELPRNPIGKVLKPEVIRRLAAGQIATLL